MLELSVTEIDEVSGAGIVTVLRDYVITKALDYAIDNRAAIGNAFQTFAMWNAQYYQPPYYA